MKKLIRIQIILALLFATIGFSSINASAFSITDSAKAPITTLAANPDPDVAGTADAADECKQGFFGLVPWYQYMGDSLHPSGKNKCKVKCFNIFPHTVPNECGNTQSDIPGILLAILDDLLRISGIVAISFLLVGAFQYIGSRGNPEATASARNTFSNALVGLVIALIAVAFVTFIGKQL